MSETTAERFAGHDERECGEHRTTGPRAWCFECQEWCYPKIPCKGCELPSLRTAIERIREVVDALPALDGLDRNDAGFLFHVGQHDMADRVRVFLPAAPETSGDAS